MHLLSGSTCCTHSLYLAEQPTRAVVPRSCARRDACWQRGAHHAQSKKSASDGVLSPSSPRTAPTALVRVRVRVRVSVSVRVRVRVRVRT